MNMNVDPGELSRFEALASRWWDPQGDSRALHDLNPVRMRYIADHVQLKEKKVIDVGCGGGLLSEAMCGLGGIVTGIDMAQAVLDVAKLHLLESKKNVDYRLASAEQMATELPGFYDVVTCMEMLEHVPDPVSVVNACARLVRPGGRVFFSTINRTIKAFALGIVGAEYLLNMLPRGTHQYAKFIRPSELAHWCRKAQLQVINLQGVSYDPIFRRASLSNNMQINYLLCVEKIM
jgi:2-polyprenyl-6-hydroxyphenyl methylase/3-demethylubiquinone-9 3-methyltransferase